MTEPAMRAHPGADIPLHRFLTYRIARVQARLNAQGAAILKGHGLTVARWRVLALIGAAGRTTSAKLAKAVEMDKGLFSRNLAALIEEGLVAATPGEDRRTQALSLTDEGCALFDRVLPVMRARQMQLNEAVGADFAALHRALDRLEIATEDAP